MKLPTFYVFLALSALSSDLTAQDIEPVETELVAEVRAESAASPTPTAARFVPATVVSQGQVVYYTVRIRNPSTEYMREVVVTQRIPANTVYVDESASGPGAEVSFSVDGGQTFARASDLRVSDPTGVQRAASVEDYTHIRWRLRNALAPGAVALARFRAVFQ